MRSVKLVIFSDIHNDWKTLERLLALEADYYIAAGDQVSWAKGIERCGEILEARGDKVYVLPGNHESAELVDTMCARFGLHNFHERHIQVGKWRVAGLDDRSLINYTIKVSSILYFQRNTTGAALISSKY